MNVEETYHIYEIEGHGYAVENYLSHNKIDDPELRELWKQAEESIKNLSKFFQDKVKRGELEFFEY